MSGFVLTFCLILSVLTAFTSANNCTDRKPVICYWASWAIYRPGYGAHKIGNIIPEYCTHIIYTFAGINLDGDIDSLDANNDIKNGGFKSLLKLKEVDPCVKILLAIGGWNEGSEKYSLMVETEESRKKFADSVLRFLIYYGFDGLDVDWEYPTQRDGLPMDKENFVELLKLLKTKLSMRKRILSVAVAGGINVISEAYDVREMCANVDFVSIMAYDMHNKNYTSIHSPLKPESRDTGDNIDASIQHFIANGCERKKIIFGIPAYGRAYTLKYNFRTGVGAAVTGLGKPGPYTQEAGYLGYNEICEQIASGDWTTMHLKKNAAVYSYNSKYWVSYDDPKTVAQKAKYVLDQRLGGMMVWSIDTDDFLGISSDGNEVYPLLLAINKGLGNEIPLD